MCCKINALTAECDIVDCIVTGDFNCSVGARFYNNFVDLFNVNKLVCSDINKIPQAFTYSNDDHSCTSWIDHILCSKSIDLISQKLTFCMTIYHLSTSHKDWEGS